LTAPVERRAPSGALVTATVDAVEAFTGVVLTGGRSRRFGRDKALEPVRGVAMARRVADALVDAGAADVVAVGGDADALGRLGLRVIADLHPGEGPLGALVTVLPAVATPVVVVLACDMPAVDAAVVIELVSAVAGHDIAVPATGRFEATCAAYRVAEVTGPLVAAFAAGERAVHRALGPLRIARAAGVEVDRLVNVNRPEDLPR
jgi:molybdopterin-guanine dinucleotide biosynthesis protein A